MAPQHVDPVGAPGMADGDEEPVTVRGRALTVRVRGADHGGEREKCEGPEEERTAAKAEVVHALPNGSGVERLRSVPADAREGQARGMGDAHGPWWRAI
ncbi:hypothetical protein SY2F82_54920 [Streptomyces sp. Y2F8-2]|nr:hypothetical protein SY2F82_54920 [Streptomyces sp. Y2F8-2]